MPNIELFMDDPEKRVLLGLPATATKKIINPFYEATELDKAGNRKEAERIYLELLNNDFDNPVLLAALGMNYAVAEKNGLAHTLLQRAMAGLKEMPDGFRRLGIIPKSDKPEGLQAFFATKESELLNAIGTCYKHENRCTEAREYFEKAQTKVPLNPDIQNNLGTLYINEGKPLEARKHLNAALTVDPKHAQAHWNMSLSYLEMGEYEKGWPEYDWGLTAKVRMERNYSRTPLPFWNGEQGKNVVVYGEQGIGDEILFASCLPDLLHDCPNVVFECHKKLHRLFANSFPNIPIYPTREDEMITWPIGPNNQPRYPFDAKIAIGSLPRFYRNKLEEFPGTPFLRCTDASRERWTEKLAALPKKPNIGISWIGGHKRTRMEVRSTTLEQLLPILGQDANWVSLQYTPAEDELQQFETKHGIHIHHWPEATYNADYDVTAGLVAQLDLVICVCTSLVHLSGSMGIPTWVMTPSRPAWRYRLDLDYLPWYNSTVLFRMAPDSTDWQPVIEEVSSNLADLLSGVNHGNQESPEASYVAG